MFKIGFKQVSIFMGVLTIAYGVLLFFTLKTDERDVSSFEPYNQYINQTVSLTEPVVVFSGEKDVNRSADYVMVKLLNEAYQSDYPIDTLPIGHQLNFTKAIQYTGGVSGFTVSYMIGETYVPALEKTISFEYLWGSEVTSLLQDAPLRFTFDKAPWQEEDLKGVFTF